MHHPRYAPSTYMNLMHDALPSPEYTGDSDSDSEVVQQLEQRRSQLNQEIARFQAQKDREFRQFEADLKARKQHKRNSHSLGQHNGSHFYEVIRHSPSSTPPTTTTTTTFTSRERNPGSPQTPPVRHSELICLIKPSSGLKVTSPTTCLDRVNIKAKTQSHVMQQTSPIVPDVIEKQHKHKSSRGTPSYRGSETLPASDFHGKGAQDSRNSKHMKSTMTDSHNTPYLPLLDVNHDRPNASMIDGTQTEPTSPVESSMLETLGLHSSSMPTESSVSEVFKVPATKRAYTSPSVHRHVLAPIICNHNGRTKNSSKRKRVTFQLADRAIVQPSSSYEEGSSPEADDDGSTRSNSDTEVKDVLQSQDQPEVRPVVRRQPTPLDPFGRRKRSIKPVETAEEEVGMSMAKLLLGTDSDDFEEPHHQPVRSPKDADYFGYPHANSMVSSSSRSPTFSDAPAVQPVSDGVTNQHYHNSSEIPELPQGDRYGTPNTARQSLQSLKSKLQSPHLSPRLSPLSRSSQRLYPGTLEDDLLSNNHNVGFFELDEELTSPKVEACEPDRSNVDPFADAPVSRRRNEQASDAANEIRTGTSVPIDIVRPGSMNITASWMGTFGH